jgi:glycosyltransferase involved in cell wall biosynthesis
MSAPRLRVAIDATPLLGVRTGIGQVTARLIDELATQTGCEIVAYALTWRGRKQLSSQLPANVSSKTRAFPARLTRLLWPRFAIPRIEWWTGPVDVIHATNYVAPPARVPELVTIADLTFARLPELATAKTRAYARLVRVALDRGATVHTFSEFVADEVREYFRLPTDRVIPVSPGLTTIAPGEPARGHALAGADRYVLALGTVEPRKNLPVLVQAFDHVASADAEVALVVAGPDGWGVDAYGDAVVAAHHRDRIKRLGHVSDEARAALLAGASVLAYPSLYEGFGLPPLEAMQAGIPVVASNAGSLPEVLGDAALLPDPHDPDAVAAALARVLDDADERAAFARRGFERVQHYSWERAIPEFIAAYRQVASARAHRS